MTSLEKESVKKQLTRGDLLDCIEASLDECMPKIRAKYVSNSNKLGYMRVVASLTSSAALILKDDDLDRLGEEIDLIKKALLSTKGLEAAQP